MFYFNKLEKSYQHICLYFTSELVYVMLILGTYAYDSRRLDLYCEKESSSKRDKGWLTFSTMSLLSYASFPPCPLCDNKGDKKRVELQSIPVDPITLSVPLEGYMRAALTRVWRHRTQRLIEVLAYLHCLASPLGLYRCDTFIHHL